MTKPEPELLRALYDQHAAPLALYARQWCQSPDEAVQDALIKLAALAEAPDNPVAWLYCSVRNEAISAARKAQRRAAHERLAAQQSEAWFVERGDELIDAATAAAALERLPIDQREVIIARLWGQLTFEEIAEVTQTSSSTAHRRFESGLAALREILGNLCSTKTTPPTS